jgi:predicted lipopolysaccharide heptosyltransferase III
MTSNPNPQILKSSDPEISRIVLIRLRQIGDVIFTTPAIHAIRERFPHARIAYVVEPVAAPVVQGNPHLDEVIVAPRTGGLTGIREDLRLGARLRRDRYDLTVDFHGGPRASLLTWLSGAPLRVGYEVVGRSWMYTHRVARPRELRPRHSVQNQFDLLAPLGIGPPDPGKYPVEMPIGPETARGVGRRLAESGVDGPTQLIVVHVSSNSPFRRWPAESFAATIAALAASGGDRRIVVTSGPSEADAVDRIVAEARRRLDGTAASRVLRCGEFSLSELRALVENAALYIGGDSGPLHIAAASKVPIVALYGPTLPERSQPWRASELPSVAVDAGVLPCRPCEQRVCAPGDFRCLTRIAPETVVSAAERLLMVRA